MRRWDSHRMLCRSGCRIGLLADLVLRVVSVEFGERTRDFSDCGVLVAGCLGAGTYGGDVGSGFGVDEVVFE